MYCATTAVQCGVMLIVVVAAFVLAMMLMDAPVTCVPVTPWWVLLGGACVYVAVAYGATRWIAAFGLRRLMRRAGGGRLGRAPGLLTLATQGYLVAALGVLILAGWGSWINQSLSLGSGIQVKAHNMG